MGNKPCCCTGNGAPRVYVLDYGAFGDERQAGGTESSSCSSSLGWRASAVAEVPKKAALPARTPTDVLEEVQAFLRSDQAKPEAPCIDRLRLEGADWSGHQHFLLERIRATNALAGPRMRIVWWKTLEELGRIPRWPDDSRYIMDAEALVEAFVSNMDDKGKVDGLLPCICFFSHRWERPSRCALAHPDSTCHKKCRALVAYGRCGTCPVFTKHTFDYYFWIDFCGIDQDDPEEKVLGICKLAAYTAASVETVFYNSATTNYEPRSWTRVERVLSYTYTISPLFVYMDEGYPDEPIDLDEICRKQPEVFRRHAFNGSLCMVLNDPAGADAQITDPSDLEHIERLMALATSAVPLNPAHKLSLVDWSKEVKAGQHVRLGETLVMVDTDHYRMDFEALHGQKGL